MAEQETTVSLSARTSVDFDTAPLLKFDAYDEETSSMAPTASDPLPKQEHDKELSSHIPKFPSSSHMPVPRFSASQQSLEKRKLKSIHSSSKIPTNPSLGLAYVRTSAPVAAPLTTSLDSASSLKSHPTPVAETGIPQLTSFKLFTTTTQNPTASKDPIPKQSTSSSKISSLPRPLGVEVVPDSTSVSSH
ncbi:unnamed protein product [Soboliphyme baturini]|uniref:PAM2 domain-containing protein n=1 Tax=Soboliphyme baturini TaxID=241478 RepID=A0A183IA76_9BILA|nr:unnamed protein product [Soboliphyme baturini]